LEREGIDTLKILSPEQKEPIDTVGRSDVRFFEPAVAKDTATEREVFSSEQEALVRIIKPALDPGEDYKWTLSDGEKSFYAEIQDPKFLEDVWSRRITFGVGDVMRVRMETRSAVSIDGNIRNERTVKEVLRFIEPPRQMPLINLDSDGPQDSERDQ
jgi:hypothetical protein